jgi:hypothetical protein
MKQLTLLLFAICISLACAAQQASKSIGLTARYDAAKKEVVFNKPVAMPVDRLAEIDLKVEAIDNFIKENSPKDEELKAFTDARAGLLQLRAQYLVETERIMRDDMPYQQIK